ncbi:MULTISPECIES: DUF192 domain-containing protein [unclassified Lentimonas]|uniref:DUF192 domain-containing protein n=1 Tax=unclassified Lentimonas TaxID=2630993 RepID=UPI0013248191|nr:MULTISPECIES: DUF192 domain-containing protein [unclassified Lentimonas]CAA6693237.1 Unannotated [Lentimonas sp. CC10]CAA6695479.1 Unannotated [Lentimonas sp. CC19]CAA7071754.1 Unannotated [Lentimonas sp. CC11]
MKYRTYSVFTLVLTLLLGACAPKEPTIIPESNDTYFPISIGGAPLQLQLALIQSEQSKGLMHRDSMPKDHGMLFLFQQAGPRAFWMRNTRIPLDIGYFDASGRLLEIHALYPYDENSVPSRSQEVLIAVETNRGWFARNNITPGAQIDLKALTQAIKRRGQSPANFQLQPAH